jgi:KDO2-lipid IV(A) lauroyltransferase
MARNKKTMINYYIIAADQTPTRAEFNYWSHFLNQETPFYNGIEKLARSLDFTVVFMDIQRTGRGKYTGKIQLISDDPKNTTENEIMEKYIHLLEGSLTERPDNWLWSHRRWKFTKNVPK